MCWALSATVENVYIMKIELLQRADKGDLLLKWISVLHLGEASGPQLYSSNMHNEDSLTGLVLFLLNLHMKF